jgi:hypothetical protein
LRFGSDRGPNHIGVASDADLGVGRGFRLTLQSARGRGHGRCRTRPVRHPMRSHLCWVWCVVRFRAEVEGAGRPAMARAPTPCEPARDESAACLSVQTWAPRLHERLSWDHFVTRVARSPSHRKAASGHGSSCPRRVACDQAEGACTTGCTRLFKKAMTSSLVRTGAPSKCTNLSAR